MKITLPLALLLASYLAIAPRDAMAEDKVEIELTTTATSNARYYPRNIVAVWIEDSNGAFPDRGSHRLVQPFGPPHVLRRGRSQSASHVPCGSQI